MRFQWEDNRGVSTFISLSWDSEDIQFINPSRSFSCSSLVHLGTSFSTPSLNLVFPGSSSLWDLSQRGKVNTFGKHFEVLLFPFKAIVMSSMPESTMPEIIERFRMWMELPVNSFEKVLRHLLYGIRAKYCASLLFGCCLECSRISKGVEKSWLMVG